MIGPLNVPVDGVSLAKTVRALAMQARRTLKRPADPVEMFAVLRAIEYLEAESLNRDSTDLSRWLASLRRKIESHAELTLV